MISSATARTTPVGAVRVVLGGRWWAAILAILPLAGPAVGERLDPDAVRHLGHFEPPGRQGPGEASTWSWGVLGLTWIEDCLGRRDPSPDDGFPGCLGAFGHVDGYRFGVFDIVPPGGRARQVVPFYPLGEPIVHDELRGVGSVRYWDVLFDRGPDHCRLWWTYGTSYVRIADDPAFLGVSSCDPSDPDPQGMWGFGRKRKDMESDPFHTAKMYQALSLIPRDLAVRIFEGKRMMLGISIKNGIRGGSQGPSLYVRPLEVPAKKPPGPVTDATPLLWYRFTGYLEWRDEPRMFGPVVRWWTESKAHGAEFVSSPAGEATILPWVEPIVDPEVYPCSDPEAYRDRGDESPDPCRVPTCWYGLSRCREGAPDFQQPSFWEETGAGSPMPVDCRIVDPCREHTGPHCLNRRPFLILYDVDELAAVYAGRQRHDGPQPYAKISLAESFVDGTGCGIEPTGSSYDPARQLLFVAQGRRERPAVHIFSIGASPTIAERATD